MRHHYQTTDCGPTGMAAVGCSTGAVAVLSWGDNCDRTLITDLCYTLNDITQNTFSKIKTAYVALAEKSMNYAWNLDAQSHVYHQH